MPRKHVSLLLALFAALLLPGCTGETSAEESSTGIRLVDVGAEAGLDVVNVSGDPRRWYIPESNGNGAAWIDYDGDGDFDLFVGNGAGMRYIDDGRSLEVVHNASSRLYRNEGGLRFQDVTQEAGAGTSAWTNAITAGDVDNDGDAELYLACFGTDELLSNEGGRFTERAAAAGLGGEAASLWGAGATFGDVDNDGDLDLYVANYCLFDPAAPPDEGRRQVIDGVEVGWGPEEENKRGFNAGAPDRFYLGDGKGGFVDATRAAGFELEKALCSYAAVFTDVDQDGRQDLLVANDLQPCNLFHNQGDGTFREEGLQRGFALDAEGRATAAMGLAVADVDQDGDFDVLRTNFDFEPNALHVNDGKGNFVDRAASFGLAEASFDRLGWGGGFFDADLDGDLDLLVANGHVIVEAEAIGMHPWYQQSQLFEAVPNKKGDGITYRDVTQSTGSGLAPLRSARGVAFADADEDGDLDALIVDLDETPRLLENRSPHLGKWIAVRTQGTVSNRDGLGARVHVYAGERSWVREVRRTNGLYSSHDPRAFFGLGEVDAVDRIVVHWPSGIVQTVPAPPLNRVTHIIEEDEAR